MSKYRGKCKKCGTWVFGSLVTMGNQPEFDYCKRAYIIPDDISEALDAGELCFPNYKEVIFESVGQFTGLKDKNGMEIYSGDWIAGQITGGDGHYEQGLIEWSCKKAGFVLRFNGGGWRNLCGVHKKEVINNTTDNPTLLERTEQ
jgi:hypothetical protein